MPATKEVMIELFTLMVRGRAFEQAAIDCLMRGAIPGYLHVGIGQESVAAGLCCPLRREDYVFTNHRGHIHALAKGADTKRIMAELFGKRTGLCKGRTGSMHLTDKDLGLMGASAIVAGGIPIASGLALASRLKGTDQVTVCFFGDGAADQGVFHESLNMASLWNLPIIYCCENNRWAQFVPQQRTTKVMDIAKRAVAYDVPGVRVDAVDVLAVYEAAIQAIERARKGEGPTLLECVTNRWYGHFVGDPQKYRPPEELENARKTDPIAYMKTKLVVDKVLSEKQVEEIEKTAQMEMKEAIKFAEESPLPEKAEMLEYVYHERDK
jgi:pyruvate dehydrogenase E1 component alpha subunit